MTQQEIQIQEIPIHGYLVPDPFDSEQSVVFKSLYTNPPRMPNNFIVGK